MIKTVVNKRIKAGFAVEVSRDGEKYVMEFNGIPDIKYKDELSIEENGQRLDLKITRIQQTSSKKHWGPAIQVTAVPVVFKLQEVKIQADVAMDGENALVKFSDVLSFKDADGNIVQYEIDPFEIKAKIKEGK